MLDRLLRFVNERHGTTLVLGERYPTGEQGAFAVSEGDGEVVRRYVLKWEQGMEIPEDMRRAMEVTALLRDCGYPAPRYRLVGVYLAHLILRQVDWSIRFHHRAAVERWLGRADEVLGQLSSVRDANTWS